MDEPGGGGVRMYTQAMGLNEFYSIEIKEC